MDSARRTTDHDVIRQWIEERGGQPAVIRSRNNGRGGVIRIDFGEPEEAFERISWEEFFEIFDRSGLTFVQTEEEGTADSRASHFTRFTEGG